jgi:hypothetical protein
VRQILQNRRRSSAPRWAADTGSDSQGEMNASSFSESFTIRHPSLDDAQATLELVIACEVAEYGESDSSLEELVDQWSHIDLDHDAWLVIAPHSQPRCG